MLVSLLADPPCGLKQVSMLVRFVHVYMYIKLLYILTYPILRDNSYYGGIIAMRSEMMAYFISTVTVILHACV